MAEVVFTIYESAIDGPQGGAWRFAHDFAEDVKNRAERTAPFDSGILAGSHDVEVTQARVKGRFNGVVAEVWNRAYYASWVHGGTGIYGPWGEPIRPVVARFLAFHWKNAPVGARRFDGNGRLKASKETGKFIFRTVRGQPAQPWLENALETERLRRGL